jgi:hypothetical protein
MAYYVGLTDDPEDRKQQHGNPSDWTVTGPFATEQQARDWEKAQIAKGHKGGTGGAGWRYGYWYKITNTTIE